MVQCTRKVKQGKTAFPSSAVSRQREQLQRRDQLKPADARITVVRQS